MPRRWGILLPPALAIVSLLACASPPERPPAFQPANEPERFVQRILRNLAGGDLAVLEAMITPAARQRLHRGALAELRADLDRALGPLDAPRILKISVLPVMRDDGRVGLFGHARAAFARGEVELRVEIACDEWERAHEACRPPYTIDGMTVEAGASSGR